MDIDREEFYEGLLRWIMSLNPGSPAPSLEWMATGRPMAESLVLIVPEFFDSDWVEKTCGGIDDASNWRVKANGLKKLLKSVLHYYNQMTGQPVSDEHVPDVAAAARDASKTELAKMLQLILALAVNGSKRQDVIENLMKADESVQHTVMMSIQELEERKRAGSMKTDTQAPEEGLEEKLRTAQHDLAFCQENMAELTRRCHELDHQIDILQEEKRALLVDIDKLQSKLTSNESSDESVDKSKRLQNLQQQNQLLQEELFRMESAREDAKAKCDVLGRQNVDLQAKIDELIGNDAEFVKLKDEVDELRGRAAEAKKLEATVEMYKRKLDELGDLRNDLKIMHEKNDAYMKCAIEVEEERRRNGTLKTQLEAYKRQLQDLEVNVTEQTKRADKMEFEFLRSKERLDAVQQERDRLVVERDGLRALKEEVKLTQFQSAAPILQNEIMGDNNTLLANVTDMREQLMKLEHDNRMLRESHAQSKDDQVQLLHSQLEDANRRKQELETDLRLANKKVIELEASLSDLQESQLEGSGAAGDARIVELHRQSEYHSMDAQKAKQRLFDVEKQLTERDQKLKQLEEQLQSNETAMKQQEAKYKAYLEKAKTVIAAFEQPIAGSNVGSGYTRAEFDALRRQLQEKEKLIQRMQEDQEKMRIMKEQEERLVTTSFHHMALQLHKRSVDDRLSGMSGQGPSSFLARQRQVTTKRTVQSNQMAGSR